jgi:hypothetical protein
MSPTQQVCKLQSVGWNCLGVQGTVSAVNDAGILYKCAVDRIEISSDGGKSWQKTAAWPGALVNNDYCDELVVQGNEISMFGNGLYRSNDHGLHWTIARERSGERASEDMIAPMASPDGALYATFNERTDGGWSIKASVDAGRTWTRQTFGLPEDWRVFQLERVFSDAIYFFAAAKWVPGQQPALYRSVAGKSAELMNIKIDYGTWRDVQTGPNGAIFVVTDTAIQRSDDDGKTWRKLARDGID